MISESIKARHARRATRVSNDAQAQEAGSESKADYRKKRREKQKREHIINVLWKLDHHGIKEASARDIAGESDYCYSSSFGRYLNSLCDEGYLCMEVYPYAGGVCTHRFTYMLPVNADQKRKGKKQPKLEAIR